MWLADCTEFRSAVTLHYCSLTHCYLLQDNTSIHVSVQPLGSKTSRCEPLEMLAYRSFSAAVTIGMRKRNTLTTGKIQFHPETRHRLVTTVFYMQGEAA